MQKNRLFFAPALTTLARVQPEAAELVYLDPPFAVERTFASRPTEGEVRERARGPVAYDDRWPSLETYLAWLTEHMRLAESTLAPLGSIWLHLDHRAAFASRVWLEARLSRVACRGEIIWVPGNGSKSRSGIPHTHQSLTVWTRTPEYRWNADAPECREPYAATSLSMHFGKRDEAGRAYRERIVGKKTYRYYADEGRAVGSVWSDCPSMLANTALRGANVESTGYPTQKPLKLLSRIVAGCTNEDDLVVDPFCGSGTTLLAAHGAGRAFVGGDQGELAIATTRSRLASASARYTFSELPG